MEAQQFNRSNLSNIIFGTEQMKTKPELTLRDTQKTY